MDITTENAHTHTYKNYNKTSTASRSSMTQEFPHRMRKAGTKPTLEKAVWQHPQFYNVAPCQQLSLGLEKMA